MHTASAILVIIKNCCSFHCQRFDEYIIWDLNYLLAYKQWGKHIFLSNY